MKVPEQLQLQTGNLNATEISLIDQAKPPECLNSSLSYELLEIFLIPDIRSMSDQYTSFYIN